MKRFIAGILIQTKDYISMTTIQVKDFKIIIQVEIFCCNFKQKIQKYFRCMFENNI